MLRVLVLADDLTGALEVGAKFAATGLSVRAAAAPGLPVNNLQEQTVLVIDTETRHMPPEEAGKRVFELARAGRNAGCQLVYKKTDSTLRGNVASEICALADAFPDAPLLYVPAYPKMGRTVRAGVLYVEGIPVAETSFGADELNPVRESHIPTLLSAACSKPVFSTTVERLGASLEAGIYVCDGQTDSDLEAAAGKFIRLTFRIAAGPAGFVDALARLIDLPRTPPARLPRLKRVLVVNGSRSEVSIRQIQHAREHISTALDSNGVAIAADNSGWVILDAAESGSDHEDFARRLAKIVRGILEQVKLDAIAVFGGDTAYAILESLGRPDLKPVGEVLEGVPVSAVRRKAANLKGDGVLYLISKAGGFGPADVLCRMQRELTRG